MSLTDKIKKFAPGVVLIGATVVPAYAQSNRAQDQLNLAITKSEFQWPIADYAFRHGVKEGNRYHLKARPVNKDGYLVLEFVDVDGNGVDAGDELYVETNGAKSKTTINTPIPSQGLAGFRDYLDSHNVILEGKSE